MVRSYKVLDACKERIKESILTCAGAVSVNYLMQVRRRPLRLPSTSQANPARLLYLPHASVKPVLKVRFSNLPLKPVIRLEQRQLSSPRHRVMMNQLLEIAFNNGSLGLATGAFTILVRVNSYLVSPSETCQLVCEKIASGFWKAQRTKTLWRRAIECSKLFHCVKVGKC